MKGKNLTAATRLLYYNECIDLGIIRIVFVYTAVDKGIVCAECNSFLLAPGNGASFLESIVSRRLFTVHDMYM